MRSPRSYAVIVIFIGIIGLNMLMRRDRFQAYHTVDVLQLLASGACFGVGLMLLLGRSRPANEAPQKPLN